MANKTVLEHDDQFVISYELLHILHWILKHEKKGLMQLVKQAFMKGAGTHNNNDLYEQIQESEDVQNSIVDFLTFLEHEVATHSNEESTKHILQGKLLQTLDHIDKKAFDPTIIHASMKATAKKVNPEQQTHQAEELFLKELLKKWQPKNKNKKLNSH